MQSIFQAHGDLLPGLIGRQRQGFSLEQPFYTSPEIFAADVEAIVRNNWLLAGHVSQIPRAGDYFLFQAADESVIIIRDDDQQVHALLNVCRHRGAPICQEQQGHGKSLICPYHSWVFSRSGELLGCRDMPDDFDKSKYPLGRAAARVVEGLIYICLSQDPPDFEPIARDIRTFLKPSRIERTKIARHHRYLARANWKLVMENFLECYHCGSTHPEYCDVMSWVTTLTTGPRSRLADAFIAYREQWKRRPNQHDPSPVEVTLDTVHECQRTVIGEGRLTQSREGKPVSLLLGDQSEYDAATTMVRVLMGWAIAANDYAVLLRCTPLEAQLTEIDCKWLVHADAVEDVDYNADEVVWLFKTTYEQDVALVEKNQQGVNLRAYQPGPYSQSESGTSLFVSWYLNQLRGQSIHPESASVARQSFKSSSSDPAQS